MCSPVSLSLIHILKLTRSVSLPAKRINGIINSEGRDESICMSSSVECGKMAESFPRIGAVSYTHLDVYKRQRVKRFFPNG